MVGLKPPEVPPTAAMKFVSAGMAGCIADLCTFPLDTAKVRLQVRSTGSPKPRGQREHLVLPQSGGTWGGTESEVTQLAPHRSRAR